MRTEPTGSDRSSVEQLFRDVQAEFPMLVMQLNPKPDDVDLMLSVPSQDGLRFDVKAYLVADELHLTVGSAFWLEWFPAEKPAVFASYADALRGLLAGSHRVVEYQGVGGPVKALLQKRVGDRWRTVGRWGSMGGLFPWSRAKEVLVRDA